jgi:two-component system chemotaxis response regulator CheB
VGFNNGIEKGGTSISAALKIIVIGASVGGVDAIRTIVGGLPENLNAAVFVTLHIGAHQSILPELLDQIGTMPASHAVQDEAIRAGHIFVAPPDHHLTIERGRIVLTKGPRENMARPSIDPMFRSAARTYGADVIGVILTGGLNDGTAGLYEVKAQGGTAIVQDPSNAVGTSMPQSAIEHVAVDHIVSVSQIAPLLVRLVGEHTATAGIDRGDQASGDSQEKGMTAQFTLNPPVAVTCPDCGGALRRSEMGTLTQFSCHIGHVYTAEVMLAAQFLAMERSIEQAMRSLSERAELCRIMMEKARQGEAVSSTRWEDAMEEAFDQTASLRKLLTREWLHPDGDG